MFDLTTNDMFRADEGYPVDGDKIIRQRDTHPTQPFRWGDLLWSQPGVTRA